MGINDEYSRDAYNYDLAWDSDAESDDFDSDLHPEDWQDMYSQELLDAWMKIREYTETHYMKIHAGFPEFVELVLDPQDWFGPSVPTIDERIMWDSIKDMPIICDRLIQDNFFAWTKKYMRHL
jgi:hypothetical protein